MYADAENLISREDYGKGYALYAVDLTPDLSSSEHFNPDQTGNVRLSIQFAQALPHTVTCLVYAEFENLIEAFEEILKTNSFVRKVFGGVYTSDKLPRLVNNYPKAYVVNVDPSTRPGSHWVAFYFASSENGEFFDSLGQRSESYTSSFVLFLDRNCSQWTYNNRTLQSPFSNVCGKYCIYYLIYRCRRLEMSVITHKFRKNLINNDYLVAEFVRTHFPQSRSRGFSQKAFAKYPTRV